MGHQSKVEMINTCTSSKLHLEKSFGAFSNPSLDDFYSMISALVAFDICGKKINSIYYSK